MSINIRVDTNVLKDQSNLVLNDVKNIERHWQSICKLVESTRNYWEGEASDAHVKVFREIQPDVEKVIKRLNDNPVKLQMEAGVYEATEQEVTAVGNNLPNDIF
jgi:WXG100 family type VII secretion target